MPEKVIIQPLDAEEIKSGIVTKVCEALWDAMNANCDLYGCAYSKFKAEGELRLTLDNFGDQRIVIARIEIPFTPPNVFRKETGQSVPVIVENESGMTEQKAVFYKRERTSRIGRSAGNEDI